MFHFTIRDVLWLTALVALGVGWWIDHRDHQATVDSLRQEIHRATVSKLKPGEFFFW